MELISRLASKGLIHCDFNEFNLLITEDEELQFDPRSSVLAIGSMQSAKQRTACKTANVAPVVVY
eukprot:1137229-Pelagomonas_calceolata.AAC.2